MAKKPDYTVSAKTADNIHYVQIGAGWKGKSKNGREYIAVTLNARPWGEWDGGLMIYPIEYKDVGGSDA